MDSSVKGHAYLIHYRDPMSHAQHYLGWTNDLDARLKMHADGNRDKCVITSEFADRKIPFALVRLWPGTITIEKRLKKSKNSKNLCPICSPRSKYAKSLPVSFIETLKKFIHAR